MDVLAATSLISTLPTERTQLLDNLGRIRREIGPITPELSDALADHMNIRRGEVHEVVSFYSFLQVPVGRRARLHRARSATASARASSSRSTPSAIEVACLGHCDLAPVCTRGDEIVPAVTHSTNDGPAIGLGQRDDDARRLRRRAAASSCSASFPSPSAIVEELKASGLTGYGGAGFPTGIKWEAVRARAWAARTSSSTPTRASRGRSRTATCMELRPHLFLEGVADRDAVRGGGARLDLPARGVRDGARAGSTRALDEFRAAGLLDGLTLELVIGAGAYIAGEETAMLESMEGRRAMPRLRPRSRPSSATSAGRR